MPRRNGHNAADDPRKVRAEVEAAANAQAEKWSQIEAIAAAIARIRDGNDFVTDMTEAMQPRRRPS